MDLNDVLEAANGNGYNDRDEVVRQPMRMQRRVQQQDDAPIGTPEQLDRMFNSDIRQKYDADGNPVYNAQLDMKRIKEGLSVDTEKLKNSRLPPTIIESILSNPLVVKEVDPKMDKFADSLSRKMNSGLQNSADIITQLEERDRKTKTVVNERVYNTAQTSVQVDYNMIKSIVKEVVREMKDEIKDELNESIARASIQAKNNSLMTMKMTDKFLFLDSDDNVFECKMEYIGKRKKK